MLRFLKTTVAVTMLLTGIGATAYAINDNARNEAIEQAYTDIDKALLSNKANIKNMYSDMEEYERRMNSNNKALLEGSTQYEVNGKNGLNFELSKDIYNPNNFTGSGFDVNDTLKQSEQIATSNLKLSGVAQPLVLVSFSMPETTIKRLIEQMKAVNGTLVFRGFKDDELKSMIAKISELKLDQGSIIIDPTIFTRFDVKQVPTFIIPATPITACTKEQCDTPKHIKVTGDVTVDYVFDLVERTGTEEDKLIVRSFRK